MLIDNHDYVGINIANSCIECIVRHIHYPKKYEKYPHIFS